LVRRVPYSRTVSLRVLVQPELSDLSLGPPLVAVEALLELRGLLTTPPQHETVDKAHGRLEVRRLWTSAELNGSLDFPYLGQVFLIRRERTNLVTGEFHLEIVYGLTSLMPEEADPVRLLALNRGHWGIENRLHWVRDFVFDEDRCRIRRHAGAEVMAALHNLAISLLRLAGAVHTAPALHAAGNRLRPLRLIGLAMA